MTKAVDESAVAAGIALAAARTAKVAEAASPPAREPPQPRVGTGTEAIDMSAVEAVLARRAKASGPETAPQAVSLTTLVAIAADIRSGISPLVSVTSRGVTDHAWRAAQAAVVNDAAKRQVFEQHLAEEWRKRSAGKANAAAAAPAPLEDAFDSTAAMPAPEIVRK